MSLSPGSLPEGIDSPLVHGALAFQNFTIDRHAVAGPYAEPIANLNQLERDFLIIASLL